MAPPALLIAGMGTQVLGNILGGRKRKKAAQQLADRQRAAAEELRLANEENFSRLRDTFQGAFESISNLPELEISTDQIDQVFSDAQRSAELQFGRSLGEEQARDAVRETTADSLGRARNIGGSTLDLLGFAADTADRERLSMRDIDRSSISAREERISRALERVQSVGLQRADFIRDKELAEYQQRFDVQKMLADLGIQAGTTLSEVQNRNDLSMIEANNMITQSNANVDLVRGQNISNIFDNIGKGMYSFGAGESERDAAFDGLFG